MNNLDNYSEKKRLSENFKRAVERMEVTVLA